MWKDWLFENLSYRKNNKFLLFGYFSCSESKKSDEKDFHDFMI